MGPTVGRSAGRAAVAGAVALVVLLAGTSYASARIEDYAGYDGQVTCARHLPPGTTFLVRWLQRRGGSIASTLRACDSGGASEHKDGRAVDWAADATDTRDVARVQRLLDDLFRTDAAGNENALARRLGVMYLIWDDHIYSAYHQFEPRDYLNSGCTKVRTCSKTLRHRDHVHISLSRAGAAAQTSYYRARGVPNVPVLYPGTRRLNAVDTAVASLVVPSDGSGVSTPFKLTKGTTYRLVADGRFRYGPGTRVADAACAWSDALAGWVPTTVGLSVNGTSPWEPDCSEATATRETSYTARRTGFATLRLGDATPRDNQGSLRFFILREDLPARSVAVPAPAPSRAPRPARNAGPGARALTKETVELPTSRSRGVLTDRALRRGQKYRVVVTGWARSGNLVFDGNCVRYAGRLRSQFSLDLAHPAEDHLTVTVQGVVLTLRVPGSQSACSRDHRYVGNYTGVVRGRARIGLFDPYSDADNSGTLKVTLVRRG